MSASRPVTRPARSRLPQLMPPGLPARLGRRQGTQGRTPWSRASLPYQIMIGAPQPATGMLITPGDQRGQSVGGQLSPCVGEERGAIGAEHTLAVRGLPGRRRLPACGKEPAVALAFGIHPWIRGTAKALTAREPQLMLLSAPRGPPAFRLRRKPSVAREPDPWYR
jgi:hypothetical protein